MYPFSNSMGNPISANTKEIVEQIMMLQDLHVKGVFSNPTDKTRHLLTLDLLNNTDRLNEENKEFLQSLQGPNGINIYESLIMSSMLFVIQSLEQFHGDNVVSNLFDGFGKGKLEGYIECCLELLKMNSIVNILVVYEETKASLPKTAKVIIELFSALRNDINWFNGYLPPELELIQPFRQFMIDQNLKYSVYFKNSVSSFMLQRLNRTFTLTIHNNKATCNVVRYFDNTNPLLVLFNSASGDASIGSVIMLDPVPYTVNNPFYSVIRSGVDLLRYPSKQARQRFVFEPTFTISEDEYYYYCKPSEALEMETSKIPKVYKKFTVDTDSLFKPYFTISKELFVSLSES